MILNQRTLDSDEEKIATCSQPVVDGYRGGVEVVERVAEEWLELCDEAFDDQPFYRPEWVIAYLRAFAPRKSVLLLTARGEGRLAAVLPLIEEQTWVWGFPVKRIRSAANVHCPRFDLLRSARPEGQAATQAIWEFLRDSVEWDLLEVDYVPAGAAIEELVLAAKANGFQTKCGENWRSPRISLLGVNSGQEWWPQGTQAKFRANLRRRWRKLSAQGPLVLQRFDQADPQRLQRVYNLEQSGWKGRQRSAIALNSQTRQFYDQIARAAEQFGYLALYTLKSNGRDVAAHFGLCYRGRYFLLKSAYDEGYGKYSPGQLLVHSVLEDCVKRGDREFDFLGASDDFEREWTSEVRTHNVWRVFGNSWKGRALKALMFALRRARRTLFAWSLHAHSGTPDLASQATPDGKR